MYICAVRRYIYIYVMHRCLSWDYTLSCRFGNETNDINDFHCVSLECVSKLQLHIYTNTFELIKYCLLFETYYPFCQPLPPPSPPSRHPTMSFWWTKMRNCRRCANCMPYIIRYSLHTHDIVCSVCMTTKKKIASSILQELNLVDGKWHRVDDVNRRQTLVVVPC